MSSFVPTNYDLRTALVFCYHLKKTAAESHRMLVEAYGEHALGKTQCFEWFKKFKSGDFDVRNEERGKPPKKFEDKDLQALLDEDDTQTQQELAEQLNVTQKAVSLRLKAMGKIQKVGKWVKRQHKVILLHDNAPSHTAKQVTDTIEAFNWEILAHAAYSPDLAPSDYHLFASLGHALAEQHFDSYENVRKWLDNWFASKEELFFWRGIHNLPER